MNRLTTRCADGTRADECYVAELAGDSELPATSTVVVRATLEENVYKDFGNLGKLAIRQAWGSATDIEPSGRFFSVRDNGFRCFTTPCQTLETHLLNTRRRPVLGGFDLTRVGATDEQISAAYQAYNESELIVAGRVVQQVEPTDAGRQLIASQFYLGAATSQCASDADCANNEWCRPTEAGDNACVPYAAEGERCDGFTLPWFYEACGPDLVCDTPDFVADVPGVCRAPCKSSDDCSEGSYCATDNLCHAAGACDDVRDCQLADNAWSHIECVGYPTCSSNLTEGQCGWQCGEPSCVDRGGADFGPCDAVLGVGVVFGQCAEISGCAVDGEPLFESAEACEASCATSR